MKPADRRLIGKDGILMSDLIDRRAAIDAVSEACFELRGVFGRCEDALKALPTAQPIASESTCEIERKSYDTISRQQAVDELIAMREHIDAGMSVIGCTAYEMAIEALRGPEYTEQDVRDSFNSGYACGMEAAQPEPKTGKWMTDNPSNPYESDYCKCSVCGYINCTVEVLSFDGYKYCPNCGAKMSMEGEEHE